MRPPDPVPSTSESRTPSSWAFLSAASVASTSSRSVASSSSAPSGAFASSTSILPSSSSFFVFKVSFSALRSLKASITSASKPLIVTVLYPFRSVSIHSGNTSSTSWATNPSCVPVRFPCSSGFLHSKLTPRSRVSLPRAPFKGLMRFFSLLSDVLLQKGPVALAASPFTCSNQFGSVVPMPTLPLPFSRTRRYPLKSPNQKLLLPASVPTPKSHCNPPSFPTCTTVLPLGLSSLRCGSPDKICTFACCPVNPTPTLPVIQALPPPGLPQLPAPPTFRLTGAKTPG